MCFCSELLDFVDEGRESLQDIPDDERESSPEFPQLHPAAELSTPEQRSQQHEASLAEEDVPELAEDEEPNQSEEEEEERMDSEPANHTHEFPQEEEEEDDDDDALSAGDFHFHIQFILVNQLIWVKNFNELVQRTIH